VLVKLESLKQVATVFSPGKFNASSLLLTSFLQWCWENDKQLILPSQPKRIFGKCQQHLYMYMRMVISIMHSTTSLS